MENLNNAGGEVSYGVNMGDYGHAVGSSMMALMTALESRGGGGGGAGGERRIPMYSSFHPPPPPADCLVSAAAMFQAEKLQRRPVSSLIEHQLLSSEPVSSLPFVKTEEGCPYPPSRIQFHREQPVYLESTHLTSPTVTSFAPHGREIESPQFSISSSTRTTISSALKEEETEALKVKISAHPKYRSLLEAYIHCQKVGAPPDVVAQLDSIADEYENRQSRTTLDVGMDPELDRFMEAYHDMLTKYEEELTKPFKEAMAFFKKIENQLSSITKGTIRISPSAESDEKTEGGGSSDEGDCGTGEMEFEEVDHHSQDRELKDRLLRKYSGYLTGLKQEFMKKKKKGKLPKDARQKLFDWWTLHSKWPYPSETEKVALAEYTGLDQKQINNWFINQRKRHWKPNDESHSEYMVMETHNPHRNAFYVERHLIPDGSAFHLDC